MKRITFAALAIGVALSSSPASADLEWDAGGDMVSIFQEANWVDTDTGFDPLDGTVDAGVAIFAGVIVSGNATAGGMDGASGNFDLGDGFSLTVNDSAIWRHNNFTGVRGVAEGNSETVTFNNDSMGFFQFILDVDVVLNDNATVTFNGGDNPINLSTVDINSENVVVIFNNETPQDFIDEHLEKFTVMGQPAIVDTNIEVTEVTINEVLVTQVTPLGGDKVLRGDVNCDGVVDLLDVAPFVEILTSGLGFDPKADINGDGTVDLLDVAPFVELLTGG